MSGEEYRAAMEALCKEMEQATDIIQAAMIIARAEALVVHFSACHSARLGPIGTDGGPLPEAVRPGDGCVLKIDISGNAEYSSQQIRAIIDSINSLAGPGDGMNIETMPAGDEIDDMVWTKVMGGKPDQFAMGSDGYAWSPSTRIAHAWEVVEHLYAGIGIAGAVGGAWEVSLSTDIGDPTQDRVEVEAEGDTLPLAICRAALKAVA